MSHIRLSPERLHQLRQIADAEGKSLPDLLAEFIQTKIDEGVIPAGVPFVKLRKRADALHLEAQDFEVTIPVSELPAVAGSLRDLAHEKRQLAKVREGIFELAGIHLVKMASGVRLKSPITGKTYPLASSLAADLADQLEREVQ